MAAGGPDALTVRAVAQAAGTTTRAVYSLFGSRDGLVAALARQAFDYLTAGIEELPETQDAAADLIAVGTRAFRRLVREHPSLYRIAFQRIVPGLRPDPELTAARERALACLQTKVQRAEVAGLLGGKTVSAAVVEVNAMFEGLANAELRGATLAILPPGEEERTWQEALATVVRGFDANRRYRTEP